MVGMKWVTEKEEMVGLVYRSKLGQRLLQLGHSQKMMGWKTPGLGVHSLNPQHSNSQEAEAVGSLSSRPANATLQDCVSRNRTKR